MTMLCPQCTFTQDLICSLHICSGLPHSPTGKNEFRVQELLSLWGKGLSFFLNRVFLMKVFDFDRTCRMIIKSRCAELGTFLQQCIYLKYIFHINSMMRIQQSPRWNHRVPPNDPRRPRLQKRQMVKQYR